MLLFPPRLFSSEIFVVIRLVLVSLSMDNALILNKMVLVVFAMVTETPTLP